jgi:hypothetical protein
MVYCVCGVLKRGGNGRDIKDRIRGDRETGSSRGIIKGLENELRTEDLLKRLSSTRRRNNYQVYH